MGFYETEYWLGDGWGANRRDRMSGAYHPYVPDSLADAVVMLQPATAAAVARAQADIELLDQNARHMHHIEPLARLLLRSEAMASSRIEGLEMNASRLLEFEALDELGVPHRVDGTEAAVLANVAAMQEGVARLSQKRTLAVEDICSLNRMMLDGSDVAEYGGKIRERQNWIGGSGVNPLSAVYVPPRPSYVPALMDDLVAFISSSELPPLAVAAVAHAQLETIHPFVDGNGRTGRALLQAILRAAGLAMVVTPPISLVMAADKQAYISALTSFRTDDAQGEEDRARGMNRLIAFFSEAASEACLRARAFENVLEGILDTWNQEVRPRANSAAALLLPKLLDNPVVSIASAARLTGRSYEAARGAVASLVAAGILRQNARNRKSDLYVAYDIVEAFTGYERSLATAGGDTAIERPAYPVPQRVRGKQVASSAELLADARRRHKSSQNGDA